MVAVMTPKPLCPQLPRPTEAMKHDRVGVYWMFIWNEPGLIRREHRLIRDTGRWSGIWSFSCPFEDSIKIHTFSETDLPCYFNTCPVKIIGGIFGSNFDFWFYKVVVVVEVQHVTNKDKYST